MPYAWIFKNHCLGMAHAVESRLIEENNVKQVSSYKILVFIPCEITIKCIYSTHVNHLQDATKKHGWIIHLYHTTCWRHDQFFGLECSRQKLCWSISGSYGESMLLRIEGWVELWAHNLKFDQRFKTQNCF